MDRRPVSSDSQRRKMPEHGSSHHAYRSTAPGHGNNNRRPNTQRNTAYRRRPPARRRVKRRIKPQFFVICGIILFLLYYVLSAWFTTIANNSTYCDNITVNGIPITSFNRESGIEYFENLFNQQLNQTYTLTHEGKTWSFTPSDFDANLDIGTIMDRAWNLGHVGNIFERKSAIDSLKKNPINFTVQMSYDEDAIASYVDRIYDDIYIAPVNAVVTVAVDQPYITGESSKGLEIDRDVTAGMIKTLISEGTGSTVLPVLVIEPEISSDRAAQTLDIIVEYSTDVSFRGYNSRYNVRKGLSYFNGMCVAPGEIIDFNAVVGDRTEARGWASAKEYAGRNTSKGFGGGICQASTTLYGAILKAGMDIMNRSAHSMTVTYVDPSLDAAVYYGGTDNDGYSKNLVFQNNTPNAIYIYTEVTKETATVTIYGKRPEYRYELYSNILSRDVAAVRTDYVYDVKGEHVYYANDPPVLYKEGIPACSSEGWIIAYDWDTGEEVSRKQLSNDKYDSGTDIYWVGIHNEDGSVISADNS